MRTLLKRLFLRTGAHRAIEPFSRFFLTLVYFSKFSKWRASAASAPFTDADDPAYNYKKREGVYNFLLEHENLEAEPIDYLEFGVARGESIGWWAGKLTHPDTRLVGFDTFQGLPEDWANLPAGSYTTEGQTPQIDDPRVSFRVGLFQATLAPFLESFQGGRRIILHLDADLYNSTLIALMTLSPYLKSGDLLIFDEFAIVLHEFRAFLDFLDATGFKHEVLGRVNNDTNVGIKLLRD